MSVAMRYLFALFLLAHGLIHGLWLTPKPADNGGKPWPFDLSTSRLLSPMGASEPTLRVLGTGLVAIVVVAFVLSALGAAGVPGLVSAWAPITVFASVASIILTAVFWNPQLPIGVLIDVALIVSIIGNWWPATLVK